MIEDDHGDDVDHDVEYAHNVEGDTEKKMIVMMMNEDHDYDVNIREEEANNGENHGEDTTEEQTEEENERRGEKKISKKNNKNKSRSMKKKENVELEQDGEKRKRGNKKDRI